MKILIISRATLYSSPGGDSVQIIETANSLRKLGVVVDIKLTNETIEYESYDLLHFFNIIRPNDIIGHATKAGKPFVISTIFVDYSEYERKNRRGTGGLIAKIVSSDTLEYIKAIARFVLNGEKIGSLSYLLRGHKRSIEYLLSKASILLPNSDSEFNRLKKSYSFNTDYIKIPNAVSDRFLSEAKTKSERSGMLCVARIEGRKNQYNVIKAAQYLNIPLKIIGNSSPNHQRYFEACKEIASGSVKFISHIDQEGLITHYQKSKVHILASWFETTGLSTLEAAALGCNVVITDKGDTREYFEDYAFYCEPGNVESIKKAIEQAYQSDFREELRNLIIENYTWEKAAKKTLEAYKIALNIP